MIYEKKIKENIKIIYNDNDLDYIDDIILYFNEHYKKIMNFFNIKKLDKPLQIKLWNNKESFRSELSNIIGYTYPIWSRGFSSNESYESFSRIDYLSTDVENTIDLKKGIIHEFVHVCHSQSSNYNDLIDKYKIEGIATYLSNQFEDAKIIEPIEKIMNNNNHVNYYNYRALFNIIIKILNHEELLAFINNSDPNKDNLIIEKIKKELN